MSDALDTARGVTVAIRPEAILLGKNDPAVASNILKGAVIESTFLGNVVDHHIDVGGSLLRVQGNHRHTLAPGETVELSVPVAECVAMQNDTD